MEGVPPLTPDRSSLLSQTRDTITVDPVGDCAFLYMSQKNISADSPSRDERLTRSEDTVRGRTGMQSRLRWIPLLYTPGRRISRQFAASTGMEDVHT